MMPKFDEISFNDWDEIDNPRAEQDSDFSKIVMSRRAFLGNSLALGASAFVIGAGASRLRKHRQRAWLRGRVSSSIQLRPIHWIRSLSQIILTGRLLHSGAIPYSVIRPNSTI